MTRMGQGWGRTLVARPNGNVFSVDGKVFGSNIRDDSRHSRAAFFRPSGCGLAAIERMQREDN